MAHTLPENFRAGQLREAISLLRHRGERHSNSRKTVSTLGDKEPEDDASATQEQVELRDFKEKDGLSNVVLLVQGEELYVHREVLAQWSPVFMAMFTGAFQEKENTTITLPEKSVEDITLLLNCIYPPQIPVTEANCMDLLPLVEEYDISMLRTKCEAVILAQPPSLDMIVLAQNFNMPKVLHRCIAACCELPMAKLDHVNNKLAELIAPETLLNIYRAKIFCEEEKRKTVQKTLRNMKDKQTTLENWGLGRNSYTCDTHMNLKEECIHCLKNFRRLVLEKCVED